MPAEEINIQSSSIKAIFVRYVGVFIVICALAIFGFSYVLLLKPKYIQLQTAPQRERQGLGIVYSEKDQRYQELRGYKKVMDDITESQAKKLEDFLPLEKQLPELYVIMDAIAEEAGLHLDSIFISEGSDTIAPEIGPPPVAIEESEDLEDGAEEASGNESQIAAPKKTSEAASNIKNLKIGIQVSGGHYVDLKNFLRKIERSLRLLDVQSVSFSGEGETFAITLKAYYLKK